MNAGHCGCELSGPLQRAGRIGELPLPHIANAEFVIGRSKARTKLNRLLIFLRRPVIITLFSVLAKEIIGLEETSVRQAVRLWVEPQQLRLADILVGKET